MIVDAHVHYIANPLNSQYVNWLKETGNKDFGPIYLWNHPAFEDMTAQIEEMDYYGIDKSIITYSANVAQLVDVLGSGLHERRQVIQYMNNELLKLSKEYVGRILPCAWIDPNDTEILEKQLLDVKENDFVGISILCAYKKDKITFVDHPDYEIFWKLAEKYELPVFLHFSNLYHIDDKDVPLPGYMSDNLLYAGMGQLMEDSLCVARIALSGIFDRYPRLKVVMGQLGGMLPFMMERFDMLYGMYLNGAKNQGMKVTKEENPNSFIRKLSDYRSNIYVDTHSMSKVAVEAAIQLLGEEQVLYGSDFPITPSQFGREHGLKEISTIFDESVKDNILYKNALKLLNLK